MAVSLPVGREVPLFLSALECVFLRISQDEFGYLIFPFSARPGGGDHGFGNIDTDAAAVRA